MIPPSGDWIHLLPSWDALCSTVDTASYLEDSFALRSVQLANRSGQRRKECSIQRDCQDLNFHRLSVKSCQIRAGKCTNFSQQIDR